MQNKYRNLPVFIPNERKTIIYMQVFALVVYTWSENVVIYLFQNRVWQIRSCYLMKNFASVFCHADEDCIYMNNAFKL